MNYGVLFCFVVQASETRERDNRSGEKLKPHGAVFDIVLIPSRTIFFRSHYANYTRTNCDPLAKVSETKYHNDHHVKFQGWKPMWKFEDFVVV